MKRILVQAAIFAGLIMIIVSYGLYTSGISDFRLLGIGDLNPYGGWSALREFATDSSHTYDGVSRSMALTIALLTMAVLGGRFFCGWICPMGTLQDFSSRLGRRMGIPGYTAAERTALNPAFLKYIILLCLLMVSILGYGSAIAGISPWRALLSLPRLPFAWAELWPGFIILSGIFLASLLLPRFFCRYLCPLGAAQALFSSISLLSLKQGKGCSGCGSCLESCPVGIRSISPECIRCLKCVENCRIKEAQSFRLTAGRRSIPENTYAVFMLIIFFVIWLVIPELFAGSSITAGIPSGALKDGIYQGDAKGFAGNIVTEVTVADSRIAGIRILKHHESSGWYEEVFMRLPEDIIRKQSLDADAVSGATKTSRGLVRSVESALKKALSAD